MRDNFKIPKTLDNGYRCFGIPIQGVVFFAVVWEIMYMFDLSLWSIPIAPSLTYLFLKYRTRKLIKNSGRWMYWFLPEKLSYIKGVKGFQRKFKIRGDKDV